jgi:drug/metabolite transporter (DMT)-like permease
MQSQSNQKQLLGIALLLLAMFLFPLKDALAKMTDGYYSAIVVMWTQMMFASLFYIPVISLKYGPRSLWPANPVLQIVRAASVVTGIGMFYWAITMVPLAEATAIVFVAPLVTTMLSPFMLGEKVGPRRWVSVFVGLAGVMIVLRPEFGGDRLGYMVAFFSGIALGFFYAFNRLLADKAPPLVNLAYSSVIGAILLTPLIFSVWVPPRPEDFFIIIGFCAIAAIGQLCLFISFLYGEASILAPLTLSQIVGATLFGYLFFGDFPDAISITGILIVVASTTYIAIRETRPDK